jgi:hypothetical protein
MTSADHPSWTRPRRFYSPPELVLRQPCPLSTQPSGGPQLKRRPFFLQIIVLIETAEFSAVTIPRTDLDQAARYLRYACELLEREAFGAGDPRAYRDSQGCRGAPRQGPVGYRNTSVINSSSFC